MPVLVASPELLLSEMLILATPVRKKIVASTMTDIASIRQMVSRF